MSSWAMVLPLESNAGSHSTTQLYDIVLSINWCIFRQMPEWGIFRCSSEGAEGDGLPLHTLSIFTFPRRINCDERPMLSLLRQIKPNRKTFPGIRFDLGALDGGFAKFVPGHMT